MTNTPELSRRGFLGAGLALIAAPAVVRAESLMRVVAPPDWRGFVRELRQYDPVNDEWALRWDVRFRGQQFHATARAYQRHTRRRRHSDAPRTCSRVPEK